MGKIFIDVAMKPHTTVEDTIELRETVEQHCREFISHLTNEIQSAFDSEMHGEQQGAVWK